MEIAKVTEPPPSKFNGIGLGIRNSGAHHRQAIAANIRAVSAGSGEEVSDVCKGLELLKAGKKINYQGASGNVDIDENGDVVGVYDIWQVQADGKTKTIGTVAPAK